MFIGRIILLVTSLIAIKVAVANGARPNICNLEVDQGPCKAIKPRYFFNTRTCRCELFNYGGCQGNANRFVTQDECIQTCGARRKG